MNTNRKQKIKLKGKKRAEHGAKRQAIVDRIVKAVGLKSVFDRMPPTLSAGFARSVRPGIEVAAAEDSRDDPEIKAAVSEIKSLLKRPVKSQIGGREFELAPEDLLRGYTKLVEGFLYYSRRAAEPNSTLANIVEIRLLLDEARRTFRKFDRRWVYEVAGTLLSQIFDVTDRNFRVDGRIISAKLIQVRKPEGTLCPRFEVRLDQGRSRVVKIRGKEVMVYPCQRSTGPDGLTQLRWNCPALGIEGPRTDLPVFIDKHAIERLHERIPLTRSKSFLDNIMVDSLQEPVFFPAKDGRYLVEVRAGECRLGYFVIEVTPSFVWVVTFLFLTMAGTPEAKCLWEKVGLTRKHIEGMEGYDLDDFYSLVASNIADDPLLARILTDCGCGHMLSWIEPEEKLDWLGVFGNRLKKAFDIREAPNGKGFMVGRKWIKWSKSSPPPQAEVN